MEHKLKEGTIYKHFKGELYAIVCVAKDTEADVELVIYRHLRTKSIYARPLTMFFEKLDKDEYPEAKQDYRFEYVV